MPHFDPKHDIPNLEGRVAVVTGGNSGIGEAIITALAQHNPSKIYLVARSLPKAEEAVSRIRATSSAAASANIDILLLDLASVDSIKKAAARVISEAPRLDLLHLNGGIGMNPHDITKDGYELQFGVMYFGHVLLTRLLMPLLLTTTKLPGADVRIVAMSSIGHKAFAPKTGIQFKELKTPMKDFGAHTLYGHANLAKCLLIHELAERYPAIISSSLHPGTVKGASWSGEKGVSTLLRVLVINPLVALTGVDNHEGAKNSLWLSFSPEVKSGGFYMPVGKPGEGKLTRDDAMAKELWKWTTKEFQAHGVSDWPEM